MDRQIVSALRKAKAIVRLSTAHGQRTRDASFDVLIGGTEVQRHLTPKRRRVKVGGSGEARERAQADARPSRERVFRSGPSASTVLAYSPERVPPHERGVARGTPRRVRWSLSLARAIMPVADLSVQSFLLPEITPTVPLSIGLSDFSHLPATPVPVTGQISFQKPLPLLLMQ